MLFNQEGSQGAAEPSSRHRATALPCHRPKMHSRFCSEPHRQKHWRWHRLRGLLWHHLGGEGSTVPRPVTTAKHGLQAPLPQAALRACKSQPQGSPPLWRILKIAQDRSRKETREVLTSAAPELYCCFNSINFPQSLQLWLQSCYTVQEKPLPGFHRSHAVS